MRERIRVLIADPWDVVRTGVRTFLNEDEEIEVVGEAADGNEALSQAGHLRPHVILIDPRMPGTDGEPALRVLLERQPAARIVILGSHGAREAALDGLRAGALGLVDKTASRATIRGALHRAARGEPTIPPQWAYEWVCGPKSEDALRELTRREIEILRLVASGLTNQQIANRVHVCEGTVRTHMTHILDKLGAENRVQAALCAWRAGLAPPPVTPPG